MQRCSDISSQKIGIIDELVLPVKELDVERDIPHEHFEALNQLTNKGNMQKLMVWRAHVDLLKVWIDALVSKWGYLSSESTFHYGQHCFCSMLSEKGLSHSLPHLEMNDDILNSAASKSFFKVLVLQIICSICAAAIYVVSIDSEKSSF